MIDRQWEQWTMREVPRVEMASFDYDPNCQGCRTEYDTEREYMSTHTCVDPDRRRPFVPQPFDPHYTVVHGTHLLTLPQLPPHEWEVEHEAKRTRHMLAMFGVKASPSEVRSITRSLVNVTPKKPRRSKKEVSR